MSRKFYAIADGEVHPFNCYKNYSELDALVAYAKNEEHAMELVSLYEHGKIQSTVVHCENCGGDHEVLQESA